MPMEVAERKLAKPTYTLEAQASHSDWSLQHYLSKLRVDDVHGRMHVHDVKQGIQRSVAGLTQRRLGSHSE
jgi:hypothetical protein